MEIAMFRCGQSRDDASGTLIEAAMFITTIRISRMSVLRALVAAAVLMIVAGVATVTFVVVGVAACGVALLRAIGRIGRAAERNVPFQDRTTIEGVVVDSTDASPQLLRTDGDTR
jgi:hypothetical protein